MADQQHPIVFPATLLQKLVNEEGGLTAGHLATQAAQWGADQELEACVKWVSEYCPHFGDYPLPEDELRAARRPKPPGLKAQALESLHHLEAGCEPNIDLLRRALEALPND